MAIVAVSSLQNVRWRTDHSLCFSAQWLRLYKTSVIVLHEICIAYKSVARQITEAAKARTEKYDVCTMNAHVMMWMEVIVGDVLSPLSIVVAHAAF